MTARTSGGASGGSLTACVEAARHAVPRRAGIAGGTDAARVRAEIRSAHLTDPSRPRRCGSTSSVQERID
jgi:hypothetical protein